MFQPGVIASANDADDDLRTTLEEGFAQYMGDGLWVVFKDGNSIHLTDDDMHRMLRV